jgi:hypothetical protein
MRVNAASIDSPARHEPRALRRAIAPLSYEYSPVAVGYDQVDRDEWRKPDDVQKIRLAKHLCSAVIMCVSGRQPPREFRGRAAFLCCELLRRMGLEPVVALASHARIPAKLRMAASASARRNNRLNRV